MSGDWIKMRPSLLLSPKVNAIAKLLEEDSAVGKVLSTGFNGPMCEIVKRNVMRNVTLASLVTVWGAANEHTSDGIFRNADLSDIDDMVGIPGFGDAMEAVGWAKMSDDGESVILPNFSEYNTCGRDRAKEKNAERQRRYRERRKEESNDNSNVSRNVTNNVEKRREEYKKNKQKKVPPRDWKPSQSTTEWFAEQGFAFTLDDMVEQFIDTCHSQGKKYLDFDATLRNWAKKRQSWIDEKKPNEPDYPDLQA